MRQAYDDQVTLLDELGASKDHVPASIAQLANLGTCGKYENNVRRHLVHLLGDMNIPEPCFVDSSVAKVKSPDDGAPSDQSRPFLIMLPHETFFCLYHENPDRFHDIFLSGETSTATLEHFWRGVIERRDPCIKYYEVCGRDGWMRCAVPLCVHCDAVPCLSTGKAGTKPFDVSSMQGLSTGPTKTVKLFVFGISQGRRRKCACSAASYFVVIAGAL